MGRALLHALVASLALGCATQAIALDDDAGEDPIEDAGPPPDVPAPLSFDVQPTGLDAPGPGPDAGFSPDVPAPPVDRPVAFDVPAAQDVPFTPVDVTGPCPLGTVRCAAGCVDLRSNPSNCGRCDLSCGAGRACVGGFCEEPCPAPRLLCQGVCTDPSVDPSHCGACDSPCPAGAVCNGGRCASRCAAGQTLCGAACVDTLSSALHCGACNSPCPSGTACAAGRCTAPMTASTVGGPCVRNVDCQPGWTCQVAVQGWPGGYCMLQGCTRDSECGPAGTCLLGSVRSACFARCVSASQCRAGYACVRLNSFDPTGLCFPSCVNDVPVVCGEYACNARTELCTGGCASSLECSNNSVCVSGDCYCTARTNCGPNRRCYTADGYCGCANDSACGPDARCDLATGGCVDR